MAPEIISALQDVPSCVVDEFWFQTFYRYSIDTRPNFHHSLTGWGTVLQVLLNIKLK